MPCNGKTLKQRYETLGLDTTKPDYELAHDTLDQLEGIDEFTHITLRKEYNQRVVVGGYILTYSWSQYIQSILNEYAKGKL